MSFRHDLEDYANLQKRLRLEEAVRILGRRDYIGRQIAYLDTRKHEDGRPISVWESDLKRSLQSEDRIIGRRLEELRGQGYPRRLSPVPSTRTNKGTSSLADKAKVAKASSGSSRQLRPRARAVKPSATSLPKSPSPNFQATIQSENLPVSTETIKKRKRAPASISGGPNKVQKATPGQSVVVNRRDEDHKQDDATSQFPTLLPPTAQAEVATTQQGAHPEVQDTVNAPAAANIGPLHGVATTDCQVNGHIITAPTERPDFLRYHDRFVRLPDGTVHDRVDELIIHYLRDGVPQTATHTRLNEKVAGRHLSFKWDDEKDVFQHWAYQWYVRHTGTRLRPPVVVYCPSERRWLAEQFAGARAAGQNVTFNQMHDWYNSVFEGQTLPDADVIRPYRTYDSLYTECSRDRDIRAARGLK